MNFETSLKNIENFLDGLISHSENIFQVGLKINPGNNIVVLLDADDGITIEKCTKVNKALYKYIEDTELFPGGNFSLEVSSPGVDEPLKLHRQYKKNIGRKVEVIMNDGTVTSGKLIEVSQDDILIEENEVAGGSVGRAKGHKALTKKIKILFNQIKHTKVLVTF